MNQADLLSGPHAPVLPALLDRQQQENSLVPRALLRVKDEFVRSTGICQSLSPTRPVLDFTVRCAGLVGSWAVLTQNGLLQPDECVMSAVYAAVALGLASLSVETLTGRDSVLRPRHAVVGVAAGVLIVGGLTVAPYLVAGQLFIAAGVAGVNVLAHNLVR